MGTGLSYTSCIGTNTLAFPFPLIFLLAQILRGQQCETDTAIILLCLSPPSSLLSHLSHNREGSLVPEQKDGSRFV